MLKLINIKKDYVTKGVPTVHALKGLTLNFRRNEFVAILGASGCGKTTLLNIIGGLDRYTEGDLIIEGKSTKDYKDGDWDTYRNHSVGFVFQSYNLIPHQSILKNVELSLTISGVSKEERRTRSLQALKTVGLEGMEKKRPNQLSGGQMQRVAIARSLVNNPEILLADEPTGALDSETSIQIMDLLKEVAKDRLVIMVTHNPDLAYKYATRIVKMSDGLLTDDSNPYEGESQQELEQALAAKQEVIAKKGNKKQTSMSFFTATALSFSNLLSKLKRTILIAVAGSIGIIGVSSVLAVSFGVRNYISGMQDEMLSEYPLRIAESSIDLTSLLDGLSDWDKKQMASFDLNTEIGVNSMINYLMEKYSDFTSVKNNDINKELISYIEQIDRQYVNSISYNYGIDMTNNVFTEWVRGQGDTEEEAKAKHMMSLNGLTQMYISELRTVEGFSNYAQFVNLFTNFMRHIPGEKDFIMSQYDLLGNDSYFPTNADELLLVVDDDQTMTDFLLAQLGFFSEDEFLNIATKAIRVNELEAEFKKGTITQEEYDIKKAEYDEKYPYPTKYTFDDLLGKKLTYHPHDEIWTYKAVSLHNIEFTISLPFPSGDTVKYYQITFNLLYSEGEDLLEGTLSCPDFYNNRAFDIQLTRESGTKDPEKPYLGNWLFALEYGESSFDVTFQILPTETNNVIALYTMPGDDHPTPIGYSTYTKDVIERNTYYYPAEEDPNWTEGHTMKITGIAKRKENLNFSCMTRGLYYTSALNTQMMEGSRTSDIVSDPVHGLKNYIGSVKENNGKAYEAFVEYEYTSYRKGEANPVFNIKGNANALNTGSSISDMFSMAGAKSAFETDKASLRLLSGLSTKYEKDAYGDLTGGYTFEELPSSISIYPKDFKAKDKITEHLSGWNEDKDITVIVDGIEKTLTPDDREELTYTDTIEVIINIINTLIMAITIALVAFTSLSLVVSCFMIAVITYISVMERVKEIGVIRSLGGRKKDVSRLFIAETLIIGLGSGLIGVLITYILELILNLSVAHLGIFGIAALPIWVGAIMVLLSITLNVLSGLAPSMRASRQDPVVALRSE